MIGLTYSPKVRVSAVDVLIAGDVVRVVLDGAPVLKAATPDQVLNELRDSHEPFRQMLMEEPRGHAGVVDMGVLYPPTSSNAARTIIVGTQAGYVPLAGTPLLASTAALIETGNISSTEPETSVVFDTGLGQADVTAEVRNGRCVSARWLTTTPKVISRNHKFVLNNGTTVIATVVSSGLPFLVASAIDCGAHFEDQESLGAAGAELSRAGGQQLPLADLGLDHAFSNYIVMLLSGSVAESGSTLIGAACVMPDGSVSRMPSGLGTLSVAASLVDSGMQEQGRYLQVRSPAGFQLGGTINEGSAELHGETSIVSVMSLIDG